MQERGGKRQWRRGSASIALVLILIVAEFAIITMVLGGARDQDLSVTRLSSVQAFFAAEAGVNMALREVIDETDHDGNGVVGGIDNSAAAVAALHGANVAVLANTAGSSVTLASVGEHASARHSFELMAQVTSSGGFGTPHGLTLDADLEMKGSSRVDSFDSSTGVFVPGVNNSGSASVATNTTGNDDVELKDSARITGDVYVGVGGNPVQVIETKGSSTISGSRSALDEPIEMPTVTAPGNLPSSAGNVSFSGSNTSTITAGVYHYDQFEMKGSHVVTIEGDVTLYCSKKFELKDSAVIKLADGAKLTVYADFFELKGSTKLNMPDSPEPANPSRVQLLTNSSNKFEMKGSTIVSAVVVAPESNAELKGSAQLFGVLQAKQLELKDSFRFTQDIAITSQSSGGGGSGGTSSVALAGWSQIPPQ